MNMSNHAQVSYDVIGTPTSPVTLTAAFTGNIGKAILAKNFKKFSLNYTYTPADTGNYVVLEYEYSNDPITAIPTNWYAFAVSVPTAQEVDVYGTNETQMGTDSGTPVIIPAQGTSTGGQVISNHIMPDTDLLANWVRVKVKEVKTTTFGTLYVGMSLQA